MKFLRILCYCCILFSNSSFADVKIQLLFDGAPFVAKVQPNFTCLNDSNQQWFNCELTPTLNPGEYIRKNLTAGSYSVLFDIDENQSNPKTMPGDFRADFRFQITSSTTDQTIKVPMTKLIQLVKPQSNNGPIDGILTGGCQNKPLFIPAGHPWTKEMSIPFQWEPIATDATYKVTIVRNDCKTGKELGNFTQFETRDTSIELSLPPNAENEHYSFFIFASRGSNNVNTFMNNIGTFITYDGGVQGWNFGFKISPVSTPTSYYIAAIVIVILLILIWFTMSYWGVALALRVLIQTTLTVCFVLVQQFIPTAKSYPPYKYFDVPPVLLANKKPSETKISTSAQIQRGSKFAYSWAKEISKPDWWDSVTPTHAINNYSELMLRWQSHDSNEKSQNELFKAIYQAIENHPDDEQLVVTGMQFLFYLSNDQKILSQVGRVAIQYHLHHLQRIDNCVNCSPADTIAGIATRYAYFLSQSQSQSQGQEQSISMLESVLSAREKDMSNYVAAETYTTLIEMLYQVKNMAKAREKLNYALVTFANTNRLDRLKALDKLFPRGSENTNHDVGSSTSKVASNLTEPIHSTQTTKAKTVTTLNKPKNTKPTDLRYCLELGSNYEIAKCANNY